MAQFKVLEEAAELQQKKTFSMFMSLGVMPNNKHSKAYPRVIISWAPEAIHYKTPNDRMIAIECVATAGIIIELTLQQENFKLFIHFVH